MFYIEWSGEEIPTTTRIVTGQNKVSIWSSTITVRAKEDFLGGNDILSNGNEAGQNQVYDPNNNYNPKKDFPKTTMNPKLLDLHLSHYEDTIFKGEEISPESLYDKLKTSKVQDDNDSKWFIDYLKRNSKKLKNNENYYIDVISGRSNPLNDNIVTFSKSDRTLTIEVPYYYLEVSGNKLISYGVYTILFHFSKNRALIYVFRPDRLGRDLGDETARAFLKNRGYESESPKKHLACLMKRMKEDDEFPHEVGLFLGYPPKDVQSFTECRGRGYKCCGN